MACQSQRGLPLFLTHDHISSISASASPARSRSQATSAGFSVRRKAVFTDSSAVSFFLSSRSTVLGQICNERAVSRTPLAFRLMSMIMCLTSGKQGHSVFVEVLHDRFPEAIKGCVRGGALLARQPST